MSLIGYATKAATDAASQYGPRLLSAALNKAAVGTLDEFLEPKPSRNPSDGSQAPEEPNFFRRHKKMTRNVFTTCTSFAIPALLASSSHVLSEQHANDYDASGQQSAVSFGSPNYGTNIDPFVGAPPAWLSPPRTPSRADFQSHYPQLCEVPSSTITCSRSHAPKSADQSDSDNSTTRSKYMCAPTSVRSAHDPRASYFTPGLDWVHGQIYHDPFARSSPSIVFQYDQEQVSSITEGIMTDIPRARDGSTADQSELSLLEEDAFSRD